jgi:hypothetical protein
MIDITGESIAILPSQFYAQQVDERIDQGIRRLFCAMLTDALNVYRAGVRCNKQQQFAEVDQWLREERDDRGPFSFVSICEALGVEPRGARKAFFAWKIDFKERRTKGRIARRPPVVTTSQLRANPRTPGSETFVRDALMGP